ncbi:hypothetical protein [Thiocystis violacea]|uniref:hypothetical protein n=1 Tax=Thiocystis violacea TaxID=13725 RepID=UPI0019084AEF|nr:hypothetical protein [Thiocystis violacea]MBK1718138.1 hypothetical protein [Thiocystis violacea]
MTNLREMIRRSKAVKKEVVAVTVRIPKELQSFADELATHLGMSRQDVLLKLIEEGASVAEEELQLDDAKYPEDFRYHLLNTNKGNNVHDHEMMLRDGVAAAFYDPWKHNINRIAEGDVVFLYENGRGIVAYGRGTGSTQTADHEGDKDECHFQELSGFRLLEPPLSAAEIKKTLNREVVFLRTMTGISDGAKLLERIET